MEIRKRNFTQYLLLPVAAVLMIWFLTAGRVNAEEYNYYLTLNGEWVDGSINEIDDAIFYKFELPYAGFAEIQYMSMSIKMSDIRILDETRSISLGFQNSWAPGITGYYAPYSHNNIVCMLEKGTYYVKIDSTRQAHYPGYTGNFKLRGIFTPADNMETEPNNEFPQVMPLSADSRLLGILTTQDTLDIYSIEVPYDQQVLFTYISMMTVEKKSSLFDYTTPRSYCSLWDQDYMKQYEDGVISASEDYPRKLTFEMSLKKGRYFIKIEGGTGRYYLSWSGEKKAVSSIKVSGKKTLAAGKTLSLRAAVQPADAYNKAVSWSSSDPKVASVDTNGNVTAKKAGSTTITAAAKDGGGAKGSIKIIVSPKKMTLDLQNAGRQTLQVKWKKQSGVSGYQIQYSLKSSMQNSKKKLVGSVTTLNLSGLKSKKVYYVRIRAFYKSGSQTYYGAWSDAAKITVK